MTKRSVIPWAQTQVLIF